MKLKIVTIISCLLSQCLAIPVSTIVRLNGLTVSGIGFGQAQTTPFLPSFGLQPADLGFPPQLVPLNPQLAGPFMPQAPPVLLPAQTNQVPPGFLPPPQQEQPGLPLDATVAQQPQQGFNQMIPQYYPSFPYPQRPGGQIIHTPISCGAFAPPWKQPEVNSLPLCFNTILGIDLFINSMT
uniref:Apin n=1 Tax=Paramormyrops kingsleyae TaxID=1676925 RepID=A0A3B3SH07_9TELE